MKKSFNTSMNYRLVAAGFILAKLAIHFLAGNLYELHRDEMLLFNMGEHLAAGYATVPPLTGFLAFITKSIFGFSVFGIRFFPALMGAISLYLISVIIKDLGGGIAALVIASSAYLLAPGFLLIGNLFSPNAFEELIWLIITLVIFRMVRNRNPKLLILSGILAGFGFLNKYSVLFLVAAIVAALWFSNRRNFLKLNYLLPAAVAGSLIALPNIIWQYNHGWPVMIHMGDLRSSQLDLNGFAAFPLSLFSLCQGSVLVWMTGLAAMLFYKEEKEYRYLGYASGIVLLFFFTLKGKGYYALAVLPFLLAFGGYALEKYLSERLLPVRNSILAISVTLSVAAIPSGLPVLSFESYEKYVNMTGKFILHPFLDWDDGTHHQFSQAYADMTGWNELALLVAAAYNSLSDEEKRSCTIFAERNYGYAGAIWYYGRKYGLPPAVTFHESYVFWAPDSIPAGPLIYIHRNINDLDQLFSDVREAGKVENRFFRENGMKVFLCRSPKKDVCLVYKELALKEKKRYSR